MIQRLNRLYTKIMSLWDYCSKDVWSDTRKNWWVDIVKTLNLSVQSFFNADLQSRACAMTYRTLLAVVPALALIFAVGRGFGLQNVLQTQLKNVLPAQHEAIDYALNFVDTYLSQSSEGVFVGIGLIFLLWTLISMMGSVEDTFNTIWGVKGRSYARKFTDYTAMFFILPVVMICASGLTLMMSNTLQSMFDYEFISPLIGYAVEFTSWLCTWLFFALAYYLMPNTKVRFTNALAAGFIAGSGFLILQWIFVSGQMYVARYNAIYGSVSFLPLMLIWMQLTYVIMFAGAVVCYSSQNIFMYNFSDAINDMSPSYHDRLLIAVAALVTQRFVANRGATTLATLIGEYGIPPRLASLLCDKMVAAGIFAVVDVDLHHELKGYQPSINPASLTVSELFRRVDTLGSSDFIPDFKTNFGGVIDVYADVQKCQRQITDRLLLTDIKIKNDITQ